MRLEVVLADAEVDAVEPGAQDAVAVVVADLAAAAAAVGDEGHRHPNGKSFEALQALKSAQE